MSTTNNGHTNGNGLPGYVHTLLTPTGRNPQERKSWSVGVESVWVPFFAATNVMGETSVPDDVLGMPLRLAKLKDGAIRFSDSGRPVMRVAPELNAQIGIVRENFVASLQAYTGMVQDERPDEYKGQVDAAQQAARPILEKTQADIDHAVELLKAAEAARNTHGTETLPETAAAPSDCTADGNGSETPPEPPPASPSRAGSGSRWRPNSNTGGAPLHPGQGGVA